MPAHFKVGRFEAFVGDSLGRWVRPELAGLRGALASYPSYRKAL